MAEQVESSTSELVPDGVRMVRRLKPEWVVDDPGTECGKRISSLAFNNSSDGSGTSVYAEDILAEMNLAVNSVLGADPQAGIGTVTQEDIRPFGQTGYRDYVEARDTEPWGKAHSVISGNKTKSIKHSLARVLQVVQWPAQ